MSRDKSHLLSFSTLQSGGAHAAGGGLPIDVDLHPRLRAQIDALQPEVNTATAVRQLLVQVSKQYELVDEERRGVVRSMQLLAEEARSFVQGLASTDAGHLQAILDHIKDVVITVSTDGAICVFNPTGETVFGYSRAEVIGVSIARLLPEVPLQGSLERGLREFQVARATQGRRKNGELFPVEAIASLVRIDRRDVYVFCLRDMSERQHAEQALRDSEARYRTLVESAPEVIVVIDVRDGTCADANANALQFFGVSRTQIGQLQLGELLATATQLAATPPKAGAPPTAGAPPAAAAPATALTSRRPQVFEWLYRLSNGSALMTEVRLLPLPGSPNLVRASITDISDRKRAQTIMAGERDIFERIAADAPLREVLEATVSLVESLDPECLVSIGRLSADGRSFTEIIGSRLPAALRLAEEQTSIDVRNGSSAAAVYLGRAVLVGNTRTDPYWQRRRELAQSCDVASAWSLPIKAGGGRVLGALSVYRAQPGKPQERDLDLFAHAARLAGIAMERRYAAEALRASEVRFRGLYESVLEGVYQLTAEGRVQAVNPAFVKMLGYARAEDICALPTAAVLCWNPAERAGFMQELERNGAIHNAETLLRRRDGAQVVVLESARVLRDELERVVGFEGTMADITERKRSEQAIFEQKERAQVTLQSIGDGVITTDREGRIDYLNPVAEQLSGWRSLDACGASIMDVLRLRDEVTRTEIENPLLRCLREDKVVNFGEHSVLVNRLGQEIAIQDSAAPIRDRDGRTVGAVVVFRDVTKERRLKRALSFQASHDALTGLINRREFDNRLQQALQSARDGEGNHALLYVDLDQFKVVNDTCGHSAGDRLLRDVTALLQQHVRSADVIARLGGDEFGILVQHCSIEQAARIAETVRQAVRDYRFDWEQNAASIGASIGVVEISGASDSVATLMSAADIACYAAKDAGRNRVHVYESGEVSGRHREMYWVSRVTRAIDENRLELEYQEIRPVGAAGAAGGQPFYELLVRLRGNDGELILPAEFIPAAERYNVIGAIDRWVVERAVALLREMSAAGKPAPLLALNLSGNSIGERNFLDLLLGLVEDPLIGRNLCFEITEGAAVINLAQAQNFMQEMRKRGCRFALDDFGSGLSSFQYLKSLPIDFLKIDGEFFGNVKDDPIDRNMVEAISKVAAAMNIATIAERVESAEALERVMALGIRFAQGHHLSRPAPLAGLLVQ